VLLSPYVALPQLAINTSAKIDPIVKINLATIPYFDIVPSILIPFWFWFCLIEYRVSLKKI
jgi:hypothetical protein